MEGSVGTKFKVHGPGIFMYIAIKEKKIHVQSCTHTHVHTYIHTYIHTYRISLNNGPGVYYLYSLPAPGVKLRQAFI